MEILSFGFFIVIMLGLTMAFVCNAKSKQTKR